jgi:hypothetical protein
MYISSKFKSQLSFNGHLNLSKVCATQSDFQTLNTLYKQQWLQSIKGCYTGFSALSHGFCFKK